MGRFNFGLIFANYSDGVITDGQMVQLNANQWNDDQSLVPQDFEHDECEGQSEMLVKCLLVNGLLVQGIHPRSSQSLYRILQSLPRCMPVNFPLLGRNETMEASSSFIQRVLPSRHKICFGV